MQDIARVFTTAILLIVTFSDLSESGKCTKYCTTSYSSAYKTACGMVLWGRCTKYRTKYRQSRCDTCCPGYMGVNCDIPWCISGWNSCPNGGTCESPNNCVNCNEGYYSPNCKRCTTISGCELTRCTTVSDQRCERCLYDRGGLKKAYSLENSAGLNDRVCRKRCSWRSDSLFCYPGRCPSDTSSKCPTCVGTPASCQCAPGFGPTNGNCLKISATPNIMHCLAKLIEKSKDEVVERKRDDISASQTKYTNHKIDTITVNMVGRFHGLKASEWPKPYFINSFNVGVTRGEISSSLIRGSEEKPLNSTRCTTTYDKNNPNTGIFVCKETMDIREQWKHGDRILVRSTLHNGGYVQLNKFDTSAIPTVGNRIYYTGTSVTHSTHFTFDFVAPSHCSVTSLCNQAMLDVGPPFTRSEFDIRWGGWQDGDGGIKSYQYDIYQLAVYGDVLSYKSQKTIHSGKTTNSSKFAKFTPKVSGVYAVELTVLDVAGNHRKARRFVMYDSGTKVDINSDKPLYVSSANSLTNRLWINNLQFNNSRKDLNIHVKWEGRFQNKYHLQHKLLNRINDSTPALSDDYQQRAGQPPAVRSMAAIPHVNGIVRFLTVHRRDDQGGRTLPANVDFTNGAQTWTAEEASLMIPRSDGDSVRIYVKAVDVMGGAAVDSVLVHVDSSPPVIEAMGLTRHGHPTVAVHHSTDLSDINFAFTAFDNHSGLKEIRWFLHDTQNMSNVHGRGNITVQKITGTYPSCKLPECTCLAKDSECYFRNYTFKPDVSKMEIPHGKHKFDYYFVLTVTNNAMLKSTQRLKITIDASPPSSGIVQDSQSGTPDVDVQQTSLIHCSWGGFLDKESGVAFYLVVFGLKCEDHTFMMLQSPNNARIRNTTDTSMSWQAPEPGKYFCTVVAYNSALSSSEAICSDGVQIESSTASIIYVQNVKVYPVSSRKKGRKPLNCCCC